MSEQNYIIKAWGQLFEILFRGTKILSHWGDTISQQVINENGRFRMDLRLITQGGFNESTVDLLVSEFASICEQWKYWKDKLKTVLCSKIQLNSLVHGFPDLTNDSVKSIVIPFVIVMQVKAEVFDLRLYTDGLYVVHSMLSLAIPDARKLKRGGGQDLILKLKSLKKLCAKIRKFNNKKRRLMMNEKERDINTAREVKATAATKGSSWTRPIVLLPALQKNGGDTQDT